MEEKRGKLGEKESARIMKSIFEAINHCHANGIVHRDIKPQNIMIDKNGKIWLLDFGLGTQKHEGYALVELCGTPSYMAPEVIKGRYG